MAYAPALDLTTLFEVILCTKNCLTRFSQWYVSFFPAMVTLVRKRGEGLHPPLLLWCTAILMLPGWGGGGHLGLGPTSAKY